VEDRAWAAISDRQVIIAFRPYVWKHCKCRMHLRAAHVLLWPVRL